MDNESMRALKLTEEESEILRQRTDLWFLDATVPESACSPSGDDEPLELWGGLYASGHLEIASGLLPIECVVEPIRSAMIAAGFSPEVHQNVVEAKEIIICSKGCRAVVGTTAPIFSIHMDAELSNNFGDARVKFDSITSESLRGIAEACAGRSFELVNPFDLDFSYTDSANAFSVLRSLAADTIYSPLAIAIRDWHRRRVT